MTIYLSILADDDRDRQPAEGLGDEGHLGNVVPKPYDVVHGLQKSVAILIDLFHDIPPAKGFGKWFGRGLDK